MNTQRIDLDISKRDALTQMVTIGQGDASGTTIEATVYDNGAQVSLSGKSARFEMRLPDGKSYVRDTNCTVSGSKITYVVDEEHVGAVAGVTDDAYFDILDGSTVIYSTNRFRMRILRSARDGAQPAESWDSAVDDLIERGEAAIEEITKAFVPISHGGTGATNATDALVNLGALGTRTTTGPAYGPLVSVTAEGHAEQDGTPTPSDPKEIRVVRGRNLLDESTCTPKKFVIKTTGVIGSSNDWSATDYIPVTGGANYVLSGIVNGRSDSAGAFFYDSAKAPIADSGVGSTTYAFVAPANAAYMRISLNTETVSGVQLELGSTVHPYVPYGHVGLDVTANGTTTTTPIPLPSRGWVGSMPDGTHDALSIDGAGKVTWELADAVVRVSDLSFSYDSTNQIFIADVSALGVRGLGTSRLVPMLSDSFVVKWHGEAYDASWNGIAYIGGQNLILHARAYDNVTDLVNALASTSFYYPLATPTTESIGYVDLPDIPDGAVVSMPELENLSVESWTSDAVARYVRAWAARQ